MTGFFGVRKRLGSLAVLGAAAAVLFLMAILVGSGDPLSHRLGLLIPLIVAGTAAVLLHPTWIYYSLAFVLGAVPLASLPGLGFPVILVLAFAVWCAVLTHPIADSRVTPLELSVGVLVLVSFASLIVTAVEIRDIAEFIKWAIATSMVFALLRLGRRELRKFGKVFVYGSFLGAIYSLGVFFFNNAGFTMGRLSIIGYGRPVGAITHLAVGDTPLPDSTVGRLTGTYVEPNAAGISLLVAFAVAVALFRGWRRIILAGVILTAMTATLSRSAIFSVTVAVLLLLIFQGMSTGRRLAISTGLIATAVGALAVPTVDARIWGTLSDSDKGFLDRQASLADYVQSMTGAWWFGKGWGLPEFISDMAAYKSNHVANSPLLAVYRGGIFVGIAFVVVLIAGTVVAYRNARKSPWESGVIGAVFVGFAVVGLQVDFPVVTHPTTTMVWSVLIVFLIANPVLEEPAVKVDHVVQPGRHRDAAGV